MYNNYYLDVENREKKTGRIRMMPTEFKFFFFK